MAHSGAKAKTEYQGVQLRALYPALRGIRREEEQDQRAGQGRGSCLPPPTQPCPWEVA